MAWRARCPPETIARTAQQYVVLCLVYLVQVVAGIVNRTPDSFFDEGRTYALDHAVDAALAAARAGAGWVDIGGVPFSPDTAEVSAAEELDRVLPVVTAVAMASDVVISVDTFRPEVADACLAAGAAVVNDTTGLRDPELAAVVAARGREHRDHP